MKSVVIGLTGGIGCGKTEVAKIFQQLGAKIIDADEIGKSVVETQPNVLTEIVHVFGRKFVDTDGTLKRKELGRFVFADEEKKRQLNRIVHPHLFKRVKQEIEVAQNAGYKVIVVDAALIYETGIENIFDKVIVVNSDLKNRIERIKQRDQLTEDEINHRIASQMPLEEKARRANIVITNNGSVESLKEAAEKIFRTFFD
ncbi:dephospho-CoA kinase [bacterium]|nr:MAG: dephospho-CoA kinase [bacterium]